MTSLNRNKRKTKNRFLPFGIFACVIIIVVQICAPGFWFRLLYPISLPFQSVGNFANSFTSPIRIYFSSKSALTEENANLKSDIAAMNIKMLSLEALESENASLMKYAGRAASTTPSHFVFAEVTDRPPFSPYDTLIVEAGTNDDITTGNPVFTDDGTPVGTVAVAYPSESKISLFSSSGTSLPVMIGTKKTEVLAAGQGGGNFTGKIAVGDAPSQGDAVYISEFGSQAIGTVSSVSAGPTDAFATIYISAPENIFDISYVSIDTTKHFEITNPINEATTTPR